LPFLLLLLLLVPLLPFRPAAAVLVPFLFGAWLSLSSSSSLSAELAACAPFFGAGFDFDAAAGGAAAPFPRTPPFAGGGLAEAPRDRLVLVER
jgi:hypothetical protein